MDMKEYLRQIKNLEILAYEQSCIRNNLEYALEKLGNTSYTKIKPRMTEPAVINLKQIAKTVLGVLVVVSVLILLYGTISGGTLKEILIVVGVVWLCTAFPIIIIVDRENYKVQEKLVEVKQKNHIIDEKNIEIQRKNELIKLRVTKKESFLSAQRDEISRNYNQTQESLRRLYSKDIIHPKYRNLIAICSMYEYFDTERCTSLTGHEGAYNIYENEIRLNLIISKMDMVIKNLEQIKQNQYELYCAMSESNRQLGYINNNLNNILSITNDVAESAALTEYNSRIAAQNTEVIKWIEIFDHM